MKWILLSFIVCFCIQHFLVDAAASEASCMAEHDAVKTCIHAIFADAEEARTKRKAAFAACFTDNKCTNPEDKWKAKKESMAKKFECKKNVFKTVLKPKLEGCVQNIFPDFTFPNISGEHMHHGHHRGHHGGRGHHGHHGHHGNKTHMDKCAMREKFFEDVCPDEAGRKAAKACLEALRADRGHEGHHHMKEKKRQMKACFKNNTTPECRERHAAVKAAVCSCAAENLGNSGVKEAMDQCHNSTTDVHEEDEKAEDHEHHRKAMRHMVKMFCHQEHHGKHGHHKGGHHEGGMHHGGRGGDEGSKEGGKSKEGESKDGGKSKEGEKSKEGGKSKGTD